MFFFSFAVGLPYILRWQVGNVLREYGAEQYIEIVVASAMERIGIGRILTGISAALSIAAGVLMRMRAAPGLHLLMLVSAVLVGEIVIEVAMHPRDTSVLVIIRGFWWAFVFFSAFRTNKWL
ncbi:hypothetical protein C7C56_012735 [Massilia glaciei]|uniref:Uncharacterized protein n=2 Tax=Massilia glaciei TaxID=1524097 RepID=A0A2U2HL90_9BURK|nr:hypothetical protein C7C56_012735 [Massilia glaciei]